MWTPTDTILLIVVIFCIIMSGYFSATETALSTFNRIRVKNLAEKGNKKAKLALKLTDNYDTLISTILIGNNIVNILASALATILFTKLLSDGNLGATVATAVMTVVVLIFGEISPKSMAKNAPEKFAMFSAPIINVFYIIFFPISFIFKQWQKLLSKMAKPEDDPGLTEEELISIIEEAAEDGDIDEEESTLIKSAIEFNDLEVGDIFTPRIDITALPVGSDKATVATVFSESGYSRIPVYDGDLDNIIGIIYYKDFFTTSYKAATPVSEIIKPVIYVTMTMKISDLLKELQEKQLHLAVVSDEYGSTAGIVTLEDILEEIVGEIWDEHDEIVEEIKEVGEKEYVVSGMANLDKLFDELNIDAEPEALTVSGWVMDTLGRIPEQGDSFEDMGLTVKVLNMDGRRVENLHILDNRKDEDENEDSESDED